MHRVLPLWLSCAMAVTAAPNTMIKAEHYEALKALLTQGDVVFAFTVRDRDPAARPPAPGAAPGPRAFPKTFWNDTKFTERMAALNAIHDPRVEKALVLSSIEDFKTTRARIPKDVRWIMYNSEPGMTPGDELENIEASVSEFARLAHEAGMKLDWAPVGMVSPQQEARFLALAPKVDAYLFQHQRVLQDQGLDSFVSVTEKRAAAVRRLNPKCSVSVQVVIGRGTLDDLIAGLRRVSGVVDSTAIWTMQDTEGAAKILEAIRPK